MSSELNEIESSSYINWKAPENFSDLGGKVEIDRKKISELRRRLDACEKQIDRYKQMHKGQIEGQSNFIDISLNRLGVCKADLRVLEKPEGYEPDELPSVSSVENCLRDLETYLQLCEQYGQYSKKECTKLGFFPDLNVTADTLSVKGQLKLNGVPTTRIRYYIHESEKRLTGKDEFTEH